jgi:hypothetical protein
LGGAARGEEPFWLMAVDHRFLQLCTRRKKNFYPGDLHRSQIGQCSRGVLTQTAAPLATWAVQYAMKTTEDPF